MDELSYVKSVSSWDSGGGVMVDLIELKDGRVLGISDEVLILYKNMEDLVSGGGDAKRSFIAL